MAMTVQGPAGPWAVNHASGCPDLPPGERRSGDRPLLAALWARWCGTMSNEATFAGSSLCSRAFLVKRSDEPAKRSTCFNVTFRVECTKWLTKNMRPITQAANSEHQNPFQLKAWRFFSIERSPLSSSRWNPSCQRAELSWCGALQELVRAGTVWLLVLRLHRVILFSSTQLQTL